MTLDHKSGTHLIGRILGSIFQDPIIPRNERERRRTILNFLILHIRPLRVRKDTISFTHTFGLGGMSLVLMVLLAATGLLLMSAYVPSPTQAYQSIQSLEDSTLFGSLIRAIHHWSANLLVALALFHLLRVFFKGAYHGPRRFNWIIGIGLLAGILAANFTGYLLPWDQLSYWAVTICTGMLGYIPGVGAWLQSVARGGEGIGQGTLVLFSSFHTSLIPMMLFVMVSFHFWRIRKARGVISIFPPNQIPEDEPEMVSTLPDLLIREVAVGLTLLAIVMLFSAVLSAPLGLPANPGMSPNPAKAPWYFLGFQELQIHFKPLIAVVLLPMLGLLALLWLPYMNFEKEMSGPWFLSTRGRKTALFSAIFALMTTPLLILVDEFWFQNRGGAGWPAFACIAGGIGAFAVFLSRRYRLEKAEMVQALFVLFLVGFAVLTITGIFFRGPGMTLVWPGTGGLG